MQLKTIEKMKKNEIIENLKKFENVKFNSRMKKDELYKILQDAINSNENNSSDRLLKNDEVETMSSEYIKFLNENNIKFDKNENNEFVVYGLKKHLFIKIDDENKVSNVSTILNKKMTNDEKQNKLFMRNILILKSLKATRSYTLCHVK